MPTLSLVVKTAKIAQISGFLPRRTGAGAGASSVQTTAASWLLPSARFQHHVVVDALQMKVPSSVVPYACEMLLHVILQPADVSVVLQASLLAGMMAVS
jgi:hypothetical protein